MKNLSDLITLDITDFKMNQLGDNYTYNLKGVKCKIKDAGDGIIIYNENSSQYLHKSMVKKFIKWIRGQ